MRASLSCILVSLAWLVALAPACSDDEKKGTSSCATKGCPAGQVCGQDGKCRPAQAGTITVATPEARACEILFSQDGSTIVGAVFGDGVEGAFRQRPPRAAVAFSRTVDQPFAADAVSLQVDGSADNVRMEDARCFDASGAAIAGADVRFSSGS